ncbi:N-acetylglucosaminyl-diphospho-decaprenol L-rhamnosyltransferase [Emticicia aquatica]|jgi:GT2 family glycosyltransferase|uniref:N-acetylglucosaminyl-diphospho-decaprenol L-rhamnosyltransferase n=1 Tax=Emticicia aquatica TaxID=1681835 RepID=A0ABM9AR58_9BACT|nr:glycosyltransferase family 2 protein [Emticicia aquatica]CAH0995987.1 N-acetylglucosaminyl-diphospho-decaprenol L-rhamnosyltransferase [Emticicia aquatica]
MNQPLVSIITVNFDTPEVTADMLRSLALLTYPNWEVIVVDNASPKKSSAYLKKEFPFITHVSTPINLGFAGGNNIGLHYVKGEYAFLVNNDTEVTPNLIDVLVEYLQKNPSCGIACPKIKYHFMPDTIQYAGAIGLHPLTSRSYDIGYLQKDDGKYDDMRETDLPNGAAMMIPMAALKKVGQMSEMFFLYYEELDWAARFKKNGYGVHYVGTAQIFHKESVSTGKNSAFKTYYLYRNRFLYIRRNYVGFRWLIASAFFVLVSSPVHILKHLLKKEQAHAKSIWQALIWNFTHSSHQEPANHSSTQFNQVIID